jgi:hypothetical protein
MSLILPEIGFLEPGDGWIMLLGGRRITVSAMHFSTPLNARLISLHSISRFCCRDRGAYSRITDLNCSVQDLSP